MVNPSRRAVLFILFRRCGGRRRRFGNRIARFKGRRCGRCRRSGRRRRRSLSLRCVGRHRLRVRHAVCGRYGCAVSRRRSALRIRTVYTARQYRRLTKCGILRFGGNPRLLVIKTRGNNNDFHFVGHIFVDTRAENDVCGIINNTSYKVVLQATLAYKVTLLKSTWIAPAKALQLLVKSTAIDGQKRFDCRINSIAFETR